MKKVFLSILAVIVVLLATPSLQADPPTITLCTWNLEHLAARDNAGCRPRTAADYQALCHYAAGLNADIIAFQEIESVAAARRVFDPETYRIEISARPDTDLGWCRRKDKRRCMQRTGFAVRKDLQKIHGITIERMPDVTTLAGDASERWGVHLRLLAFNSAKEKKVLHLLCVHLKSGCAYDPVRFKKDRTPCSRLAVQVSRLEAWMDARAAAGEEFIVLGDMNRQLDGLGDPVWEALDDSESCDWETPDSGPWYCRKGTARFNRIADLERARAGRKHPYPHHPRYPYAVDHIIMSAGADQMAMEKTARFVEDKDKLSDHTPLVMELEALWP